MNRRTFLTAAALILPITLTAGDAEAAEKIKIVASFSILGDMVRQIGGDRVEVATLDGPNSDAHVFQPTPSDAKTVAEPKLLVINGLGFEGWMTSQQKSSGFKGTTVVAAKGVKTRQMEEAGSKSGKVTDPHAWQCRSRGQK
jgi:zinc/manganese transport system substrate-binding protein